jgi:hypothetical protein
VLYGPAEHAQDEATERDGLAQHERDEIAHAPAVERRAVVWARLQGLFRRLQQHQAQKDRPPAVMLPTITSAVATRPRSFGSWGRMRSPMIMYKTIATSKATCILRRGCTALSRASKGSSRGSIALVAILVLGAGAIFALVLYDRSEKLRGFEQTEPKGNRLGA